MAGKSTYLRQNALIAVMAQMGSFVPAKRARLGLVDRLFSRVGAADDLSRGRSTFIVEMVETRPILNQATEPAAVILDETRRDPQLGERHTAGDPRRDRPRHSDIRRPLDRLGGDRAPARAEPLPRAVRDAFPRADRAGGEAQAPPQRDGTRQGMARRRGVPA